MKIFRTQISTPLGNMYACATEKGICLLEFENRKNIDEQFKKTSRTLKTEIEEGESNFFPQLKNEMSEYFAGTRENFEIPLDLIGTDFQKTVWQKLLKIPFGKTLSYMQLAIELGNPKTIRAVANANALNKIAIIVPCHRVIGSDNSLTGYAGGLERKRWLLNHERREPNLFTDFQ